VLHRLPLFAAQNPTQFCVARLAFHRSQGPRPGVHRPRPRCPMHLVSETIYICVGRFNWELPKLQVEVLDAHGRWLGVANTCSAVSNPTGIAYRKWSRRWRAGPFTSQITTQTCTQVPTACITCDLEASSDCTVKPGAAPWELPPSRGFAAPSS
jgi:hypothetical protein